LLAARTNHPIHSSTPSALPWS